MDHDSRGVYRLDMLIDSGLCGPNGLYCVVENIYPH